MLLRAGIDEAGRGPVLGPLVAAVVVLDAEAESDLRDCGVTDSKLLSPKRREALAVLIRERAIRAELAIADPARIDAAMADPASNLNRLEAELTAELLTKLPGGSCVVAIDLPSRNEAAYRADILRGLTLPAEVTLLLEHKADLNHVACAAASILAKVERDRRVRAIEAEVGVPVGSGYPSDPVTRAFLASHGRSHRALFRTRWGSYTARYPVEAQTSLSERF